MGIILIQSEEYMNGFRRYIASKRNRGRPCNTETVSVLDHPQEINNLPPIGEKVLISNTLYTSEYHGDLLYDCYETDVCGRPIIYKVLEIDNGKVCFERIIETYNETISLKNYVPCTWFTSGYTSWITVKEFYKKMREEDE